MTTSRPRGPASVVPRSIRNVFLAREQGEGAGAKVRRSIGTPQLRHLTPFLMLDHFYVAPGAGFPDHPHRGQETITYLLEGAIDHEDFAGNKGTIGPGDLQFMTAGRGIMHAEMPSQSSSLNVGMQLWVDLPEKLKSCEPRYRDLRADEIPLAKTVDDKVTVKVISGRSLGVESLKDLAYTPVWLLDITIQPGGTISQPLPGHWNAFAYTLSGAISFTDGSSETDSIPQTPSADRRSQTIQPYHIVVFNPTQSSTDTDPDVIRTDSDSDQESGIIASVAPGASSQPGRFILVAGQPLDQPIVQHGPFVTTSQRAVVQAMMDFRSATNGFERSKGWESEIGKSMA